MENELLNDFIRYVKISTQSDDTSKTSPSTSRQLDLAKLLLKELKDLGLKEELDQYGRLYASLEGNDKYEAIGLCAHMDTALEASGENVKPQVIYNYDLKPIKLGSSGLVLDPKEFSHLKDLKGKTIITTSGDTLLGGDDKCGVAIIMNAIKEIKRLNKEDRHPLKVLFTPDEEIGRGAEHFNIEKFNCKYAYTVDGDSISNVAIETFNAASIDVIIKGKSIHPGDAKDVMVNSVLVASDFINNVSKDLIPAKTSGREGFNHLTDIKGEVEETRLHYIIRNHDKNLLEKQIKDIVITAKEETLRLYPKAIITCNVSYQYKNMIEIINKHPECKEKLEKVYKKLGISFEYVPVRGGTDGANFSFMGVPTPNLGTGSYNHHGKYEYAVLEEMEQIKELVKEIFVIQ